MRSLAGLVGLLMFLGFGWLFVDSWNEWRAYPAVPTPMTVREAMELDTPGPGAWVTLTNARLPCSEAEQRPSSAVGYRLAFGETREERVIIGDAPPCSDTALTITGVLKTAELGRIVDLEFPGAPFTSWPKRYQSTLWTASGPDDTKLGLFMMPPFALMGLVVLAFYWRPSRGMASRTDGKDILSRYAGPCTVVVGSEDVITPVERAKTMQDLVAGSTLEVVSGAGHLTPLERPAAFRKIVEALTAGR